MSKVLLIAGHGKNYNGTYDPGACSAFGREADYNRELVTLVQQAIGGTVPVDVYDTTKNCYSYSKAGQVPDYGAYGVVLEIHFNAKAKKDEAGDGSFTGMGAYVHPDNAGGREIAENIITAVVALGFKRWQICTSTGLLNLNRAQRAGTKYLLLETAFLDDGDDMTWYNANKAHVAQAIAQEIIKAAGGSVPASKPQEPVEEKREETYKMNTLKRNSKGNDVTIFESIMKKMGYYTGEIDTNFGPKCVAACNAFQERYPECGTNGQPDSSFGPKCWAKALSLLR